MAWESPRQLLSVINKRISESGILSFIGYQVVDLDIGYAEAVFHHDKRLERSGGIIHGGVIVTALDTTMGLAAMAATRGENNVTLELKVNFLEPLDGGLYKVKAKVLRKGLHTVVVDGELLKGQNVLAAKALGTYFIVRT
ncbi:PaaI family thioesterase [Thermoproteus tenax]|uniref:PaaI family thioesterase n=1 Tax=Thermoproteus tenax (strain ATCC 35583 / DSM 2078 / JCM 9277 / NBRC 100435 / Kra 1) TaxID=768679 RepID=G4RM23_THETK|nr:PaaI family thioesterase [Thermoproteus tenax]CCC82618.1 PaaI family thioesterase [Thermoproteus tenax Kra 1]